MRKILTLLSAALLLAACSTPKYTYHFDHYDYNSGKKKVTPVKPSTDLVSASQETLALDEKTLVASSDERAVYVSEVKKEQVISKEEIVAKIKALSKEERKELKKEIKAYVKENRKVESVNSSNATSSLSGDLKLAAIFGAVGIVLLIIGGSVLYIIGAVALIVGLYFLIRYLSHS